MDRRRVVAAIGAIALGAPLATLAQPRGKLWRVGILSARKIDSLEGDAQFAAFFAGMAALGYVRGKNLAIEYRSADDDYARLPQLAASLVSLEVDVILAAGAPSVAAAQKATQRIPIVMATAGDPVGSGFVRTLARPGGNITGLTDAASDMGFKLIDTLVSAVPGVTHVAVLLNPDNSSHATYVSSIQQGARGIGVRVLRLEARNDRELDTAFSVMGKERVTGVIALTDPMFNSRLRQIAALAAKYRLPCVSGHRQYVHAGGLMNYGPNFPENFRRAATFVDRIFKGASPADLPVEQSTRFELAVNLKTARTLGITIPGPMLVRADEVVQ